MGFYGAIYKIFSRPVRAIWRTEAVGAENIPEGGALLISNHTSLTDVLVLEVALRRQIRFMAKRELFRIPLLSQLIRALGAYPVDRGGADVRSIKQTVAMIGEGELIGIFPQGTRCPGVDPRETEVKGGAGMIVYRAKAPVIPVFIDNKARRTRAFRRNRVLIGAPVTYEELFPNGERRDYEEVARELFDRACALKYGDETEAVISPARDADAPKSESASDERAKSASEGATVAAADPDAAPSENGASSDGTCGNSCTDGDT